MVRLGLTGGIGSGKSTVAGLLRLRGATVIDADAISRELTAAGGLAVALIAAAFGADFIDATGALDRDKMRRASFSDANVRLRLEAIIHPLVGNASAQQEALAIAGGSNCIVFDIPLLVESSRWRQRVDEVLVIDCPEEVQITRVLARSGLEPSVVRNIIASQASRVQRIRAADVVLFNGGDSLDHLGLEVDQAAHRFGL